MKQGALVPNSRLVRQPNADAPVLGRIGVDCLLGPRRGGSKLAVVAYARYAQAEVAPAA
jgi:hypothetical protein